MNIHRSQQAPQDNAQQGAKKRQDRRPDKKQYNRPPEEILATRVGKKRGYCPEKDGKLHLLAVQVRRRILRGNPVIDYVTGLVIVSIDHMMKYNENEALGPPPFEFAPRFNTDDLDVDEIGRLLREVSAEVRVAQANLEKQAANVLTHRISFG